MLPKALCREATAVLSPPQVEEAVTATQGSHWVGRVSRLVPLTRNPQGSMWRGFPHEQLSSSDVETTGV